MEDTRTVLVAATALGVRQHLLHELFEPLPATEGIRLMRLLVVDTFDGLFDLALLARRVDILDFSPCRRGFATAKRCCLAHGEALRADFLILFDGDGQFASKELLKVVDAFAADPSVQVILPQRSRIDLPPPEGLPYGRPLAERFENWCAMRSLGRDDLAASDLQAGMRGLSPAASRLVMEMAVTTGFSWDLEALVVLARSGLSMAFPSVEAGEQQLSTFTAGDSRENIAVLTSRFGGEMVLRHFDEFSGMQSGFSPAELEAYRMALIEP